MNKRFAACLPLALTVVSGATKGKQVQVPSESLLEFRLEQPASLPVAR